MHLIVCLDNKNGMLFNRRRQSQDSMLRMRILEQFSTSGLWMNGYSAKQFDPLPECVTVTDDICDAGKGCYCFVENISPKELPQKPEGIVIYRWNRSYPADVFFPMEQMIGGMRLVSRREFQGNSHDIITEEIYEA